MLNANTASAIESCFISPNECDSNLESANVVDGLFAIARAISDLSKSIDKLSYETFKQIQETGDRIATAIPDNITLATSNYPLEIKLK